MNYYFIIIITGNESTNYSQIAFNPNSAKVGKRERDETTLSIALCSNDVTNFWFLL